jgi:hypothetical protein
LAFIRAALFFPLLAVACGSPKLSGRPITRWTHRELRDEVVKRGVVESISVAQVGRYLKQSALQPHRSKMWLNTTERLSSQTFCAGRKGVRLESHPARRLLRDHLAKVDHAERN